MLFAALFVTCCALLGFGLGAVIRHSAGAIAALFGLLFVVPLVTNVLPASAHRDLLRWLPGDLFLSQIVAAKPTGAHNMFGAYGELAVFAGYAVAAVAAGALLFHRRDV